MIYKKIPAKELQPGHNIVNMGRVMSAIQFENQIYIKKRSECLSHPEQEVFWFHKEEEIIIQFED